MPIAGEELNDKDTYDLRMRDLLKNIRDMTEAQAQTFVDRYDVVAYQPNTMSGFSAVSLKDTNTDEHRLAIRGTELRIPDILEDFRILFASGGQ